MSCCQGQAGPHSAWGLGGLPKGHRAGASPACPSVLPSAPEEDLAGEGKRAFLPEPEQPFIQLCSPGPPPRGEEQPLR